MNHKDHFLGGQGRAGKMRLFIILGCVNRHFTCGAWWNWHRPGSETVVFLSQFSLEENNAEEIDLDNTSNIANPQLQH